MGGRVRIWSALCAGVIAITLILSSCAGGGPKPPEPVDPEPPISFEDTSHVLYSNGSSEYGIVVPQDYTSSEMFAAEELAAIFARAAGVEPVISAESAETEYSKTIFIGDTDYLAASNVAVDAGLGRDGYILHTVGSNVIIAAVGESGKIFGVYGFLQYNLGYVYYAADEIAVTDSATVKLKKFDNHAEMPSFKGRDVYNYATRTDADHSIRLRLNGYYPPWQSKHGEGTNWSTLNDQSLVTQILRLETYEEEHPEWFYYEPNNTSGKTFYAQLDFWKGYYDRSEGGMFQTFVGNLIDNYIIPESNKSFFMLGITDNEYFGTGLKHPVDPGEGAGQEERELYNRQLTQYNQDIASYNADLAKYKRSGMAMRFINAVADEVESWRQKNAPEREIYLVTFAYAALFEAPVKVVNGEYIPLDPSVVANDNVVVRYAPISAYYMYDLLDSEYNAESREAILGWSAIAQNLAVWDYRVDFHSYGVPYPQWQSAMANLKIYYEFGFIDIFNQGCTPNSGTPFAELDNYVRSRLLWDITLDYNELTADFISRYYKEAAPYITEYRTYLQIHYETHMKTQRYAGHSHQNLMRANYWPENTIYAIEGIFERAYEAIAPLAVSNPSYYEVVKTRLDTESIFYRLAQLELYRSNINDPEVRLDKIDTLYKIATKANFTIIGELNNKPTLLSYITGWRAELNGS